MGIASKGIVIPAVGDVIAQVVENTADIASLVDRMDNADQAGLVVPESDSFAGVTTALQTSGIVPVVVVGDQIWTDAVDITNKQVNLNLDALKLARNTSDFAIRVIMPYLYVTNVTSVELFSGDFGGGLSGSDTSIVSSLVVAGGEAILSNLQAGDSVKIVADDFIPSTDATNQRIGEHAYVSYVTGNRIVLDRILSENYVTSVRVAKNTDWPVKIKGGTIGDENTGAKSSLALIQIVGAVRPLVSDVNVYKGDARAIEFVSCMEPRSIDARLDNLDTDDASGRYGYGIIERCCTDGFHTGISGKQVRHIYTTGTLDAIAMDSRIERYGGCIGTSVNFYSGGNLGAMGDTHPDAYKVIFKGCTAKNGKAGEDTTEANFQLRGRECSIIGGISEGGSALSIVSTGVYDGRHRINLTHRMRQSGTIQPALKINGSTLDLRTMVAAGNVHVHGECDTTIILRAVDAKIRMQSLHVDVAQIGASISTPPVVIDVDNSVVDIDEVVLDYSRGTGSLNWRLAEFRDTSGLVRIGTLRVIKGSSTAGWFVADFNSLTGNQVFINNLIFDAPPSSGGVTGAVSGSSIVTGSGAVEVYAQISAVNTTLLYAGNYVLFDSLSGGAIDDALPVGLPSGSTVKVTRALSSGSANLLNLTFGGSTVASLATGQWAEFTANANSNLVITAKGSL